jgi:hypothetical protein
VFESRGATTNTSARTEVSKHPLEASSDIGEEAEEAEEEDATRGTDELSPTPVFADPTPAESIFADRPWRPTHQGQSPQSPHRQPNPSNSPSSAAPQTNAPNSTT